MKILFPNQWTFLACRKCSQPVGNEPEYWLNTDAEDYWCEFCLDFIQVVRILRKHEEVR